MKFTELPVMGERNWLNHINQSFNEAGAMVQLSERSTDYVPMNGASKSSAGDALYVWRNILTDGVNRRTIVAGAGKIHHVRIAQGQNFKIKLPWKIGAGAHISGNVFDMSLWKVEVGDGADIEFTPIADAPEADNWVSFKAEWPF